MSDPAREPIYDFVFRSTGDGILIADADQHITYINPAAAAMLGVTTEDIIGQHPRDCFRTNSALLALFQATNEHTRDVRLPRRRLATGIGDTMPGGERVVVLQDVSEKRDLEDRREMLSKAISHDLRNPIAAISGFTDLVSKFGDLNDQQRKFLNRIRQTSSKLHGMMKLLVDLAWIEAGMPLGHVPIRLDDAIERAVEEISALARRQQVHIVTSVQKPLPIIMGDPDRLHQVIYHLLHNAIVYNKPDENVVIHAWGDQNEVFCSVADRGIGIMENELELIFDRMYRGRDERVTEVPGGGLGLTLARTIINRHGGDIWVSSHFDEGSTFTFMLPAVRL